MLFVEFLVNIKYLKENIYSMSCDGGKSWRTVEGEVLSERNTLILNFTIDGAKSRVNVFVNDNFLAIFDQVSVCEFNSIKI